MANNASKKRQKRTPPLPRRNIGECPLCGIPVYADIMTRIRYLRERPIHKSCSKEI